MAPFFAIELYTTEIEHFIRDVIFPATLKLQYLVEISSIFKVSTDYLLGINETATISVSGLSDSDIELIHTVINHLRKAKSDGQ